MGAAWEKGRVERAIRYLREAFFAARAFRDVEDLNHQFAQWRDTVAHARKVPGDPTRTVAAPYDAANSGGSNLAPASKALVERLAADRKTLELAQPELVG